MLALVLSGAANYGAMQVGGLEILIKAGVKPDMVVGTSAGALNAIHIASQPSTRGVRRLRSMWKNVKTSHVGKPNLITGLGRLITRQSSLFLSDPLARFFQENLPANIKTFGQLNSMHGIRTYTTAVCMETGKLRVFGDDERDQLIDGAMASTAIPPYFPPWRVGKYRFVDGGVVAKLPLRSAVRRGATQIIALDVKNALGAVQKASDIFGISSYALSLMADSQTKEAADWARMLGVELRVIQLLAPPEVNFWDYSQADYLYELGRQIVEKALEAEPVNVASGWKSHIRQEVTRLVNRLLVGHERLSESAQQPS
jgi:NTE family protein